MHDSSSSTERTTSKKADEIVEGTLWAFWSVHISITHHVIPFQDVFGSILVRKRQSDFFKPAVAYVAEKVSTDEGEDDACYRMQRLRYYNGMSVIPHPNAGRVMFVV